MRTRAEAYANIYMSVLTAYKAHCMCTSLFDWYPTCRGWPSLSQARVGGGTASDLHSKVTCLFSSTDTSWLLLFPAILGGTATGQKWPLTYFYITIIWIDQVKLKARCVNFRLCHFFRNSPCTRTRNSLSSSPAGLLAKQLYLPVSSNWM